MARNLLTEAVEALRSLSPPSSPKSSNNDAGSFRRSINKRASSKLFSKLIRRESKETNVVFTDEMIRLETVIQSLKGRQLLIQDLVKLPGFQSVKVRFIVAVDQTDNMEDKEERARLQSKLVETFVVKGGLFTLALKPERAQAIIDGSTENLYQARREILEELAGNPQVMEIIGVVEAIDGV